MQAIGRAVLFAAELEKVLLVEIAQRLVGCEGFSPRVGGELSGLERRPAGTLLERLKTAGLAPDLAARTEHVIERRNRLIHHFLEDGDVLTAMTGGDAEPVIERIDQLAADCQALINEIAPGAFAGVERAFGASLPELLRAVGAMDLAAPENDVLPDAVRRQLVALRDAIDPKDLASLLVRRRDSLTVSEAARRRRALCRWVCGGARRRRRRWRGGRGVGGWPCSGGWCGGRRGPWRPGCLGGGRGTSSRRARTVRLGRTT